MVVAIHAVYLKKGKLEGLGWYTHEIVRRWVDSHPEVQFILLFDKKYSQEFVYGPNVKPAVLYPQSRHPILWFLWFHLSLPLFLRRHKVDVFVSPDGFIPLRTKTKTIGIIHDLAYLHVPWSVPKLVLKYYQYFMPRYAKLATKLITVSDYSKQDIIDKMGRKPEDIYVSYNGYNTQYYPISDPDKEQVRQRYTQAQPYFLFIGGMYPRKNLTRLVLAFATVSKQGLPHKLVIVGRDAFQSSALRELIEHNYLSDKVLLLGRVEDMAEMRGLVNGASALCYISLFEGFGIPCLEAMACGTPVLTSKETVMEEVCQDGALYVDALSEEDIAKGLMTLASDKDLAASLAEKGFARAKQFSWDRSAQLAWKAVEATCAS